MQKDVAVDLDQLKLNDVTLIPKKGIQEWKKFCEGRDAIEIDREAIEVEPVKEEAASESLPEAKVA